MLLYLCLLEKYSFPCAHFHISQMLREARADFYTNFHPRWDEMWEVQV